MKKLLTLLFFCALFGSVTAQTYVYVWGTVTENNSSSTPIANHQVIIKSDSVNSPGFYYYHETNTDSNGHYRDSIPFNGPVPNGILQVMTFDCIGALRTDTLLFGPNNLFFERNFEICDGTGIANFEWTIPSYLNIQFQNTSTEGTTWYWQFGDGTTSTQENPLHVYSHSGIYPVTLIIGDTMLLWNDDITKYVYVPDSLPCHAAFNVFHDSSNVQNLMFFDMSSGNINSWQWSFGDGAVSSLQNPVHLYSLPGTYVVCLTIHGADSLCYSTVCDTVFVGTNTGCQSNFTWYADTLNTTYTIHFIDQSSGGATIWNWSFGDSTYSNLQNPTHTYAQPGTYYVCLSISSANQFCSDTLCKQVVVGSTTNCISYFSYLANWLNVSFEGHKPDGMPAGYIWDFGDGTSGTGQNVTHAYATPGSYTVSMTSVEDSTYCMFITSQTISVGDSNNVQQIYGQVFAGSFPLSSGMVMIFSTDTGSNLIPYVDTHVIDSMGIYYFPYVPQGHYVIWAMPFDSAGGYLPTFYGDVIYWEQATVLNLGTAQNPYDIHLVQANSLIAGPGGINGLINSGSKSLAVDKIAMLLFNEQNQPVGFRRVNSSGTFDFSTLAYGTYYLKAELPGCPGNPVKVIINEANPQANIIMTYSANGIIGIKDNFEQLSNLTVYPNPVNDNITISFDLPQKTVISADVYDIQGKKVTGGTFNVSPGKNFISLNLSDAGHGMYMLHITSAGGVDSRYKLIKN